MTPIGRVTAWCPRDDAHRLCLCAERMRGTHVTRTCAHGRSPEVLPAGSILAGFSADAPGRARGALGSHATEAEHWAKDLRGTP